MTFHQKTTVLEALTYLLEHWDTIFLRVRQDGKFRTLSLVEVSDQQQILRFVLERLKEWGDVNKAAVPAVQDTDGSGVV